MILSILFILWQHLFFTATRLNIDLVYIIFIIGTKTPCYPGQFISLFYTATTKNTYFFRTGFLFVTKIKDITLLFCWYHTFSQCAKYISFFCIGIQLFSKVARKNMIPNSPQYSKYFNYFQMGGHTVDKSKLFCSSLCVSCINTSSKKSNLFECNISGIIIICIVFSFAVSCVAVKSRPTFIPVPVFGVSPGLCFVLICLSWFSCWVGGRRSSSKLFPCIDRQGDRGRYNPPQIFSAKKRF